MYQSVRPPHRRAVLPLSAQSEPAQMARLRILAGQMRNALGTGLDAACEVPAHPLVDALFPSGLNRHRSASYQPLKPTVRASVMA